MLNKAFIMGRLTKDVELKKTQSGLSVCSFTLAVERDFKGQDGQRECDYINCVAWRNTAEFVSKYFGKGKMMVACGSIQCRTWQDSDGHNRRETEVIVDNAYFGEGKEVQKPQSTFTEVETTDDDLPF